MIPRRLIRHLKDQNWFAVGLDLVIIVLGVFIGIQVSNWNPDSTNLAVALKLVAGQPGLARSGQ